MGQHHRTNEYAGNASRRLNGDKSASRHCSGLPLLVLSLLGVSVVGCVSAPTASDLGTDQRDAGTIPRETGPAAAAPTAAGDPPATTAASALHSGPTPGQGTVDTVARDALSIVDIGLDGRLDGLWAVHGSEVDEIAGHDAPWLEDWDTWHETEDIAPYFLALVSSQGITRLLTPEPRANQTAGTVAEDRAARRLSGVSPQPALEFSNSCEAPDADHRAWYAVLYQASGERIAAIPISPPTTGLIAAIGPALSPSETLPTAVARREGTRAPVVDPPGLERVLPGGSLSRQPALPLEPGTWWRYSADSWDQDGTWTGVVTTTVEDAWLSSDGLLISRTLDHVAHEDPDDLFTTDSWFGGPNWWAASDRRVAATAPGSLTGSLEWVGSGKFEAPGWADGALPLSLGDVQFMPITLESTAARSGALWDMGGWSLVGIEDVKVPAGTFRGCYVVENWPTNGVSYRYWFCPGVGLVGAESNFCRGSSASYSLGASVLRLEDWHRGAPVD